MTTNILHSKQIRVISIFLFFCFWLGFSVSSVNSDEKNPHNVIKCSTCHSLGKDKNKKKSTSCIGCHNLSKDENALTGLKFHNTPNRVCLDCHSFHDSEYLVVDGSKFKFDFKSESSKNLCRTCHKQNNSLSDLSESHREAKKIYHSNLIDNSSLTPSQTCLICHGTNFGDLNLNYNNSDMPVINNHASHPFEVEIVRGQGNSTNQIRYDINSEISLFDNRIECQTCHNLNAKTNSLLISLKDDPNFCTGCHEHNSDRIDLASSPY